MTAKPSQIKQRKVQGRLTTGGSIHEPGKPEWIAGNGKPPLRKNKDNNQYHKILLEVFLKVPS